MKVGIVVPWQDRGDKDRAAAMRFTVRHLKGAGLGGVHIGSYPVDGASLNRSRLRNAGAREALASGCDVLLFNDADLVVERAALAEACERALAEERLVWAGTAAYYPDRERTAAVLRRGRYDPRVDTEGLELFQEPRGGPWAMPAAVFEALGGFDELYLGWGYEDIDFEHGASMICGTHGTVVGSARFTLWHTPLGHGPGMWASGVRRRGAPGHEDFRRNEGRWLAKHQLLRSPTLWRAGHGVPTSQLRSVPTMGGPGPDVDPGLLQVAGLGAPDPRAAAVVPVNMAASPPWRVGRPLRPIRPGSYRAVSADGVLHRIARGPDLLAVMAEAHRVLQPGGTITFTVPLAGWSLPDGTWSRGGPRAWSDPLQSLPWWLPHQVVEWFVDGGAVRMGTPAWEMLGGYVPYGEIDWASPTFWSVREGWEGVVRLVRPA